MQKAIENKAILSPDDPAVTVKAETMTEAFWFSGDGIRPATTIQAVSLTEAIAQYKKYLNEQQNYE